jgi:hypothetical protein
MVRLPNKSHRWDAFILLAILIVAVIRTVPEIPWGADPTVANSIRLWILQSPLSNVFHNVQYIELAPPGWHLVGAILLRVSPLPDVFTIQIFNYVCYLALIPLAYLLSRDLNGRPAGLIAAVFIPWSPMLAPYLPRVNHYVLFAAATLVYFIVLVRAVNGTRPFTVLYPLTALGYSFIHYLALPVIISAAGIWLLRDHPRFPFNTTHRSTSDIRTRATTVLNSHLFTAGGYLLWLPAFVFQYRAYTTGFGDEQGMDKPWTVNRMVNTPIRFLEWYLDISGTTGKLVLVSALVLVAVGAYHARTDTGQAVFIGGVAGAVVAVSLTGAFYSPRHVFFLAVALPVALAYGGSVLIHTLHQSLRQPDAYPALSVLIIPILVVGTTPFLMAGAGYSVQPPEPGLDTAIDEIEDTAAAKDDVVILTVVHISEATLRAHDVAPSTPKQGLPFDVIDDRGRVGANRYQGVYDPDKRPADRERLRDAVDGRETVILFIGHGTNMERVAKLQPDLRDLGYEPIRKAGSYPAEVVVFEKTDR